MDIIQRNFLRLLRSGAFKEREPIEPMSAWKWNRLYQLSLMHGVAAWVCGGIQRCADDFFLQIPQAQMERWQQTAAHPPVEPVADDEELRLTNPLLNRRLQHIIEENQGTPTLRLMMNLTDITRHILTKGISLKQMTELGIYLRTTHDAVDYEQLKEWCHQLGMSRITSLIGTLLVVLFLFKEEEIKFAEAKEEDRSGQVLKDIFKLSDKQGSEWYFTQGQNVFVTSTNSSAMMWHVRHSAKYMHYYPGEALTNFMANFAHSLSHIEE